MMMLYLRYTLAAVLYAVLLITVRSGTTTTTQQHNGVLNNRKIEFVNHSGKRLVMEWVNPKTGDMVPLTETFEDGSNIAFDSFVNHTFAIHETSSVNETCTTSGSQSCNIQLITVTDDEQQGKTDLLGSFCLLIF